MATDAPRSGGRLGAASSGPRPRPSRSPPRGGGFGDGNSGGGGGNGTTLASRRAAMRGSASSKPLFGTVTWMMIVFCSSFAAFYLGVWTGMAASSGFDGKDGKRKLASPLGGVSELPDEELQRKVEALAKQKVKAQLKRLCGALTSTNPAPPQRPPRRNAKGESILFSKSIQHFAQGLARVSKDDLMTTFDFGVPQTRVAENLDALILYNHRGALPSDENVAAAARYEDPSKPLPLLSASQATENCDAMNVITIDSPGNKRQCYALIGGQYQGYNVQRWMRVPPSRAASIAGYGAGRGKPDPSLPLTHVSRAYTASGREEFPVPQTRHVQMHREKLLTYLTEVEDVKRRLKALLTKMDRRAVVVLTCNKGQSELLMNFACSARARGFDLSQVLVFPTDAETRDLALGMGLHAFYEEKLMATVPKSEAKTYGDGTFTRVMFAKVLCVQLVNELGYDLLFQDADVVWYKDPVEYFRDETSLPKFDLYFQDDGSRQERYAPYSANTGFYYVKSNDRTRHLFRHFVYASDLIDAWYSHQQALIQLLAEHASLYGLRVKVYPKEAEEFPGGVQYHRKRDVMKEIMAGKTNAYIFHMSWTKNKDDKLKFFRQMGEWYLKDECAGKDAGEIARGDGGGGGGGAPKARLATRCCSAEPLITCHYRDKPSKVPCDDAPFIDRNTKPF
ncbi:hypothetical protein ACHAWF_007465, partial [Thalassiosira exigua]